MAPKPTAAKGTASVAQPAAGTASVVQPAAGTASVVQPAAGATKDAASVAQPAATQKEKGREVPPSYLPLSELTDRSARIGQLMLSVFHPWEDNYTYTWEGQERSGTIFRCLLVDTENPIWYCHAEFKKTRNNEKAFNTALKQFTEGARFICKNIAFIKDSKSSFLSAPKRDVINLAITSTTPVLGLQATRAVQPCPTGTVGYKSNLQQNQRFDITVLIRTMSEARDAGPLRQCFDVECIDGSMNEANDRLRVMKITLFQEQKKVEELRECAHKCMQEGKPVTFLQLQGAKSKEHEYSFQSAWKGWRMFEASAEQPGGEKVKILIEKATALMEDQNTEVFACRTYERRDYSKVRGTETTVKLFVSLPRVSSGIADLDEEESAWQINWARIHEPAPGQNIHTQDGKRIWFPTTFQDATMQHTLWITETAALQLADVSSAAEFQAAHVAGKLWFPLISSMKIIRKRNAAQRLASESQSGAGQPETQETASQGTSGADYDAIIVEATEQDLKQSPTTASLLLLNMLASRIDTADVFLPAALHMIKKSDLYAMCVHYLPQKIPVELSEDLGEALPQSLTRACTQAFCLVEASASGEVEKIGEDGLKLTTRGVKDPFHSCVEQPAESVQYTLTAFCTMDSLQDFKLDPPRGSKSQHAIVIISDILPGASPTFIVDSVQLIHREDVPRVKDSIQKLLYYVATATELNARKNKREWTETFSPAKARKCRNLSAHPSGECLPAYTSASNQ